MSRPSKLEVASAIEGRVRMLSVVGELDMDTTSILEAHLSTAGKAGPAALTLDLRGLTFMDSSGLRLLIELNDRAKRDGWPLALIAPTEEAALMVLRVTGAHTALPFERTSQS